MLIPRSSAGYSRYVLPDSHSGIWLDAQTAEPSTEEKSSCEKRFKSVTDNGRIRGMNYTMLAEFGNPLEKVEEEILRESGPCFGTFKSSYDSESADTEKLWIT